MSLTKIQAAAGSAVLPPGWYESEGEMIDALFKESVPKVTQSLCSASDCDIFAKSLMYLDNIVLVKDQGFNSNTLMCPTRQNIMQFRLSELNGKFLNVV